MVLRFPLLTCLFFFAASLYALPEIGLNRGEKKKLESGEIVVRFEKYANGTEGMFLICGYVNASAEAVWDIITDYPHFRNLYPELLAHEIRKRSGDTEEHYSLFDYPWPLEDRWLITRVVHNHPALSIHWDRLDGSVKQSSGSWQLFAEGTRTFVAYRVRIDPGLRFIPDWFVRWGTGYMAPRVILHVREYAKKSGSP